MKKENLYKQCQKYVKDKDTAVLSFIENTLAKSASMFTYDGLPDTIPAVELERMLQTNGNAFITKVGNDLYALSGAKGGEPDVYNRPTIYTVANVALKLSKNYNIEKDGVLIENDSNGNGLLPIISKYAVLYVDGLISLNTATVLSRITMLISASDDKTKESADAFINKIVDGDFSVIGENAFFKGVNLQTPPTTNGNLITQLIENIQYIRAQMYNEIGLNANYNMKRERLNLGEVSMNVDVLLPYVDNMLAHRQKAIDKINEMYGTEISVHLGSSWKLEHENLEAQIADIETDNAPVEPVDDETEETEETDETSETEETDETSETDETDEDYLFNERNRQI